MHLINDLDQKEANIKELILYWFICIKYKADCWKLGQWGHWKQSSYFRVVQWEHLH